jgi:RNA polymerase sigma factor (sigma-70 family)
MKLWRGGDQVNDSEIIREMEISPENGYRLLFEEYHSYVYTIVYHILRSVGGHREAEECTVDVLSDVMLNFDASKGESLKAYIGTAAKHRAIDVSRALMRTSDRNIPIEDDICELASAENVENAVENSQLSAILLQKIEELGKPDSDILIQKFFFDRNSAEISRLLKINPITVRSRCRRALKRLKSALSDMDITL